MSDSGGIRFTTIDIKLAIALNAMIASSGDNGKEVGMEIKVMVLGLARRDPPQVVKGRQIIAMILESFRSSTHTDLMFTGKHLYELNYPGDSKLNAFRNQWIHILSAMREDDKPKDLALRDILGLTRSKVHPQWHLTSDTKGVCRRVTLKSPMIISCR